jgi:hypothetical protein
MAKKPKPDDKSQVKRFRKAARALGCDENEGRFQEALRKVAKHKPGRHARVDANKE